MVDQVNQIIFFFYSFDKQVLKCKVCQHRKGTNYMNKTKPKIFKIMIKYFGFLKKPSQSSKTNTVIWQRQIMTNCYDLLFF